MMKVLKFGGTSVGSSARIKEVASLVNDGEQKIVVLSAMSGTTNNLVEIADLLYKQVKKDANDKILALEKQYYGVVNELLSSEKHIEKGKNLVKSHFNYIQSLSEKEFTATEEKEILAEGELLSTNLFHFYLQEQGIDSVLIPALNFMKIDDKDEPDTLFIKDNLNREIRDNSNCKIFITQGFICRNVKGEVDNLKRGGSDYTASIVGAAVVADEIQIWTDIDGMHNNDPRVVDNTKPIANLSFDEAAELAYFGAKILHPTSVLPAKLTNVPVRLKNTMEPKAAGTLISRELTGEGIKAIAAKDKITAIKIKSGRMLLAHGFMRKIFEVFETYKTSIDMVTTSEVAVSITIDDTHSLSNIVNDLQDYGTIEVDEDLSIVSVVGNFIAESKGYAMKIFSSLKETPIRMISYGGSRHNVSFLVKTSDKKNALKALNENLF